MAMIECHECKAKISDEAKACPQCGAAPKKPTSRLAIAIVGFIVIALGMALFNDDQGVGATSSNVNAYSPPVNTYPQCVDKGVAYFKSIGAWPLLSSGEDATATAKDRCNRTVTAF